MSTGEPKQLDARWTGQVTPEMIEAVKAKADENGKITCPVLRKFAEEQGVPNKVAGAAADLAGVRVHNCDLGCF
jgi:hypothetical protein